MPKKGEVLSKKIENSLESIKELINKSTSESKTQVDLDIQLAEITSLIKIGTNDMDYKIEALTLIITELLKQDEFNQAEETYQRYTTNLKEYLQEFDTMVDKIRQVFLNNNLQLNSDHKVFQKSLQNFEKDWKGQKKHFQDRLKDLKREIDQQFDKFLYKSKRDMELKISILKKLNHDTKKKLLKYVDLIEKKLFADAESILDRTQKRVSIVIGTQEEELKVLSPDLSVALGDLIAKWKKQLLEIKLEIPKLIDLTKKELYLAIIKERISEIKDFSSKMEQQLSNLSSLIERGMFIMAEELAKEIEKKSPEFFQNHRQKLKDSSPNYSPFVEDNIKEWQIELANSELTIKSSIESLRKKLAKARIESAFSNLKAYTNRIDENLIEFKELLAKEKFTQAEKELLKLEKEVKSEIRRYRTDISEVFNPQKISSEMSDRIHALNKTLDETEEKLTKSISDKKDEYRQLHIPHLQKKVDLFIKQNISFLNTMLDDYERIAWSQLTSFFDHHKKGIRQLFLDRKKVISQEIKNKDEHIQLVFARYDNYPLKERIDRWSDELKTVQNRLSDIQTKVLSLIDDKNQVVQVLDKYYEIAQPAYGYKVPIDVLSEALNRPADKLETLFVDLISNKIISGEIDPITKVIVLAPRAPTEEKAKKDLLLLRCMVCNLVIEPSKQKIDYCPHCNSPAHHAHLIEWLRIKGTCPNCKQKIKML